jgi:DNA-directed RNA polymerase alpha subunit
MKEKELFEIKLSAPASRALANAKIIGLKQLTSYSEKEIAALHGLGNNTIVKLKEALNKKGLSFKKQ